MNTLENNASPDGAHQQTRRARSCNINPEYTKNDKGDIEIRIETIGATPKGEPAEWDCVLHHARGRCTQAPRCSAAKSACRRAAACYTPLLSPSPRTRNLGETVWRNELSVIVINPKRERGAGGKPAAAKEVCGACLAAHSAFRQLLVIHLMHILSICQSPTLS